MLITLVVVLINVFGDQTSFVWLLSDGLEVEVLVDTLTRGDIIVVHAGETIAVDGTIICGQATIDQQGIDLKRDTYRINSLVLNK